MEILLNRKMYDGTLVNGLRIQTCVKSNASSGRVVVRGKIRFLVSREKYREL